MGWLNWLVTTTWFRRAGPSAEVVFVSNGPTVILISDEPAFFERQDTWFNRRGVEVFCAMSLDELSAIAQVRHPDLIIAGGPPDGIREHQFRSVVPEGIPLVVLARPADDMRVLAEYDQAFQTTVVTEPYEDKVMRTTAAALKVAVRHYLRLLVQLQLRDNSKGGAFGFSHNVSASGILIETKKQIPKGTEVSMSFMLPGAAEMTAVTAKVVREAPSIKPGTYRYGCQFLDIAEDHKAHIEALAKKDKESDKVEVAGRLRTPTMVYGASA